MLSAGLPWLRLAAAAALLAGAFGAGWHINGWRLGAQAQADRAGRAEMEAEELRQQHKREDLAAAGYETQRAERQAAVRVITRTIDHVVAQPFYVDRDCLDPDGLQQLAAAIAGRAASTAGGPAAALPAAADTR